MVIVSLLFHPHFRQTARVFILPKIIGGRNYRNVMAFVDIFAHINILRRKRRRIQTAEIENSFPAQFRLWWYFP